VYFNFPPLSKLMIQFRKEAGNHRGNLARARVRRFRHTIDAPLGRLVEFAIVARLT